MIGARGSAPTGSAPTRPGYPRGVNVYDLTLEQLTERLAAWGEPPFRARQLYAQLWRRSATYEEMTDLPARLRERLAEELPIEVRVLDERTADRGATRKVLLELGGRHVIETVVMGYRDRVTACVSTQSGCAMRCAFCATGQMGLRNNLTAGEIAAQVVWARRAAPHLPAWTPQRVTNVVFMGMGEPFANERATLGAVARLTDPRGMGLGSRHVTISTVGVVAGIRRLPDANDQVRLAVSLHAADDELRSELVPANRLWPLEQVIEAVAYWRDRTHHRPSLEWVMIDGVNDTDDQAGKLAAIARRLRAHVNLIPLNATPGFPMRASPPARIRRFAGLLEDAGVNVTIRDTRGREIEAACGQLRVEHERLAVG